MKPILIQPTLALIAYPVWNYLFFQNHPILAHATFLSMILVSEIVANKVASSNAGKKMCAAVTLLHSVALPLSIMIWLTWHGMLTALGAIAIMCVFEIKRKRNKKQP